jgi:hypothetical protein
MNPDGRPDDHRAYDDMAVAHVMGGLDEDEGRLFRAHLIDCGDCRARVGELRAIAHELAGVERNERRVRSAKAVEMKSREDAEGLPQVRRRRSGWQGRILAFAAVAGVVLLASYTVALRTQVVSLEQVLAQRTQASAALEHGRALSIIQTGPRVTDATAKRHGDEVAVLIEGLDSDQLYGLYLIDDSGTSPRTVNRQPHHAEDGILFLLFELRGDEDRFVVTDPGGPMTSDPTGATVFEASVTSFADE